MQSPPDPKNPQQSRPPIPETLGATAAPFELGKRITTVSFEIHAPAGPARSPSDGQAKRVLLRIENATSLMLAPSFDVYLNLPPGEAPEKHPDLFALTMATFGMIESSTSGDQHPGDGLTMGQDVTALFGRLTAARDWDGKTLRVTFVPGSWGDRPSRSKSAASAS